MVVEYTNDRKDDVPSSIATDSIVNRDFMNKENIMKVSGATIMKVTPKPRLTDLSTYYTENKACRT